MTSIGSMIDPEVRKRLRDIEIVVTKRACDPNPPRRPLTLADTIQIDPESEALIEARCVDYMICESMVLIDPKTPEGVDPETGRIPICRDCHDIRAREAKQRGTFVRHVARVQTPVQKEQPMIDLDNMPDAEFGSQVRESMKAEIASEVPAKRKKAKAKKAKAEAQTQVLKERDRATRRGVVLPEFTLHGVTVPALDLSDVTDMGEVVSAKQRSPYNKVLYRNGEPLLPAGDPEDEIAPRATYADVAEVHQRLMQAQPEPVKAAKKAKPTKALVANLDADAPAKVDKLKVQALMEAMPHLSKKQAKALVAAVSR